MDDAYFVQLVNQIGKRLEQIGQIGNAQKTEVLMGAELGGFIRWHGLATLDGSLFSSTYRNNCEGLFSVMVRFEVSSIPGTSSAATDS